MLDIAQHRTRFHHHDLDLVQESRHAFQHAQGIRHQAAAPWPQLDQMRVLGLPLVVPHLRAPGADHLAEHLADFGRGNEIAFAAERLAGGVVAAVGIVQGQIIYCATEIGPWAAIKAPMRDASAVISWA